MTDLPLPPKRKRGAQPGNKNAQKHGIYGRTFEPQETDTLDNDLIGKLDDEINLMRILILRTADCLKSGAKLTLAEYLSALRSVTLAIKCLQEIFRTRKVVYEQGGYTIKDAIDLAMSELNKLPFDVD